MIGLGCRFPGGADSPAGYWRLLRDGVDAVREVPADRWDVERIYDADPDAPGRSYARRGGFLDAVDRFDPQFFGISPREAAGMDPQQRLLLEVTWEALEDAGQAPDRLAGSRPASSWASRRATTRRCSSRPATSAGWAPYYASGIAHSVASGRISYVLGLHGPSVAVDTACSSSLVARPPGRARACGPTSAGWRSPAAST